MDRELLQSERDRLLFEDLGAANPDPPIPPSKYAYLLNIFGKERDKSVEYKTTDEFFRDIYRYYYNGGFTTIVISNLTEIMSLIFGMSFFTFIFIFLDWNLLLQCGNNIEIKDCGSLSMYISPHVPSIFYIFILLFMIFCSVYKTILLITNHNKLAYIHRYFKNTLKINSRELQTMSWPEIIDKMTKDENIKLNSFDITNRILRKENYLISLIQRNVIPIKGSMYSKQLDINLQYIILNDIENINIQSLRRKFLLMGILNLVFSIFIFIYLIVHYLVTNIDEMYSNKEIMGSRRYSIYAKRQFRDYNELPHFFEKRLSKSIPFAIEYIKQFPSPVVNVLGKFIVLIAGSFVGFFLLLSILDESILLYVRLWDRTLFFYAGIIGAISAFSRSMIKPPESIIYNPNAVMKKIEKYTHYMPLHWLGKCNTFDTRDEFLELFEYKIMLFLKDLFSVLTTPFILMFTLRKKAPSIFNYIKFNTTSKENIGMICKFADFSEFKCEGENKNKKMEDSLTAFKENHGYDSSPSFMSTLFEEPITELET